MYEVADFSFHQDPNIIGAADRIGSEFARVGEAASETGNSVKNATRSSLTNSCFVSRKNLTHLAVS